MVKRYLGVLTVSNGYSVPRTVHSWPRFEPTPAKFGRTRNGLDCDSGLIRRLHWQI